MSARRGTVTINDMIGHFETADVADGRTVLNMQRITKEAKKEIRENLFWSERCGEHGEDLVGVAGELKRALDWYLDRLDGQQ